MRPKRVYLFKNKSKDIIKMMMIRSTVRCFPFRSNKKSHLMVPRSIDPTKSIPIIGLSESEEFLIFVQHLPLEQLMQFYLQIITTSLLFSYLSHREKTMIKMQIFCLHIKWFHFFSFLTWKSKRIKIILYVIKAWIAVVRMNESFSYWIELNDCWKKRIWNSCMKSNTMSSAIWHGRLKINSTISIHI